MSTSLPTHLIGTHGFLPSLLSYIRNLAAPASLPLDHVIFQSILLCLIAGDKHLILRTPEEDIGLVVKLAVWTLSAIFNLPTHKLKIRSRPPTRPNLTVSVDPPAFLRSLFLPSASNSSHDEGFAENPSFKNTNHYRQPPHSRLSKHKNSRSFPNNLAAAVHTSYGSTNSMPEPLLMSASVPTPEIFAPTLTASASTFLNGPTILPHSYSDPLPTRRRKPSHAKPPLQLPHALVISGLEYATDLTQRTFAKVLAERKVILESRQKLVAEETNSHKTGLSETNDGAWNFPDGFITVYVCPLDPRERPPIHKTLLDKFAMSTNILVAQDIRYDYCALPFSPIPRSFHPHFSSHSNPGTPSPSHPMSLPQTYTPPTFTKSLPLHSKSSSHFNPPSLPEDILPRSFLKALSDAHHKTHMSHTLSLYLADIFSATRHNSRLDATLLTAKATKDAEALIRASRVTGTDLTGMELLRPMVQADDLSDTDSQNMRYQESVNETPNAGEAQAAANVLDVSEVDVARIAPRVISHRVRVRDGPEEEILASALFGATFKPHAPKATTGASAGRETVKSLLVQILSEV